MEVEAKHNQSRRQPACNRPYTALIHEINRATMRRVLGRVLCWIIATETGSVLCMLPSIISSEPVTQDDSSDTRNGTPVAISLAVPSRPIGVQRATPERGDANGSQYGVPQRTRDHCDVEGVRSRTFPRLGILGGPGRDRWLGAPPARGPAWAPPTWPH